MTKKISRGNAHRRHRLLYKNSRILKIPMFLESDGRGCGAWVLLVFLASNQPTNIGGYRK